MRTLSSTMDKNGRIVIPTEIREELGLKPGQLFIIESENGEIIVKKAKIVVDEPREQKTA